MTIAQSVRCGIEFIEANLQRDIGVRDVADAVSYSQFYFSREFSRHTHISVYDYILRRKISDSCKRLREPDVKIVDVAFQYGFQSHEVYTRAFRKMFGANPRQAAARQPLALFEPYSPEYLEFLNGLHAEAMDGNCGSGFFVPEDAGEPENGGSALVILSESTPRERRCTLLGRLEADAGLSPAIPLIGLRRALRVHHRDARHALRYFIDNFYDESEMGGNYILVLGGSAFVDILIPN